MSTLSNMAAAEEAADRFLLRTVESCDCGSGIASSSSTDGRGVGAKLTFSGICGYDLKPETEYKFSSFLTLFVDKFRVEEMTTFIH